MYTWDFHTLKVYTGPLLGGLLTTLWISSISIFCGTIIGILLAVARKTRTRIIRYPAIVFIELFLAMPVLVLLIWAHYCLPLLVNLRISASTTAVLVFSLSLAAFVAETMRSGIEAIPNGQVEAGLSLQLSSIQVYKFIVLPQAFRLMLPALLTQYLTCLKLSTLASVIAVYELLHTANNIALQTYRPLEVYTVVALMFVLVILPINLTIRKLEKIWGQRGL